MIVPIVLAFALIAFLQVPKMVKNKYWRELVFYGLFFMAGFTLTLLMYLGVKIPSPAQGMKDFLRMINFHY